MSEPVTAYIRFEWLDAARLVDIGEDVRWLPRARASDLLLPGNDCWIFDQETVNFTDFSGDGHVLRQQVTADAAIVQQCLNAFEAAWQRVVPHAEYQPA